MDPALIIEDETLSIMDGALRWYGNVRKKKNKWTTSQLKAIAEHFHIDLNTPWQELPESFRHKLFYGAGDELIHFKYSSETEDASWSGESKRPAARHRPSR